MTNERDIEDLFKRARVPELRRGLKEKVMSAAGPLTRRHAGARRSTLRLAFACAVAACVLVAFVFGLLARARENEVFSKIHAAAVAATETDRLCVELQMPRPPIARRDSVRADLLARKATVERLLKGDYNGS
ncbi:MAG: hypothetical protein RDV41_09330 [Planctomycetota bacterium]|nr:hypothetical protein [Planctomycetota bacterium]